MTRDGFFALYHDFDYKVVNMMNVEDGRLNMNRTLMSSDDNVEWSNLNLGNFMDLFYFSFTNKPV